MAQSRREFIETAFASSRSAGPDRRTAGQNVGEVDTLLDRAIVVDTLVVWEEWSPAVATAWKQSGYTAIFGDVPYNRPASETGAFSDIPRSSAGAVWSEGSFQVVMDSLRQWQERFRRHADVLIHCTRAADVERAKREGKLAVMLGSQNAPFQDDVANVNSLYEAGARWIQLTANSRNNVGDGCTERIGAGLSDFGIACVERMDELRMIVDLSHCGEGTTSDGIAFGRQPCFSHTFCQALHFHPRGKSDALLRALASKGGIAGMCMVGYFLTSNPQATLEDYLNHIDRAVKICGIDHVGMSTDYQIRGRMATTDREAFMRSRGDQFKPSYNPRWAWAPELDRPDRYRTVAHALARRGYKTGDIEKLLGGNWLRYFRDVLGG